MKFDAHYQYDILDRDRVKRTEWNICYGGGKGGKAPAAPDPAETARAQGQANKEAAIASQLGSMVNQKNPWGTLTYNQLGNWSDGTPRSEAVTELTPEQMALFQTGQRTDQALANLGESQIGRLSNVLNEPFSLNNEATEARLMELGSKRLQPKFDQQREALRTRLVNQGISDPNSEAYRAEMRNFSEGENDAFNQLLLTGRGQAIQEALTARNQPINEITSLLSGTNVSMPQFGSTPGLNVNPADIMGATYASANINAQNAAQAQQRQNAMMGGLFGLGGAAITAAPFFSDRRLKKNIRKIGTRGPHNWYAFDYIWGEASEGVMADEVEKINPSAIGNRYGFKTVNYEAL